MIEKFIFHYQIITQEKQWKHELLFQQSANILLEAIIKYNHTLKH